MSAAFNEPGPGGVCDDCGHFAARHYDAACYFPRPADNPCTCRGFLWLGLRYASGRDMYDGIPPLEVTS